MTFDAQAFLQTETSNVNDTQFRPVPQGEYTSIIKGVEANQKENPQKAGEKWTMLNITYTIEDAGVRAETGLDEPTVRQTIFLDLDENGKLDSGTGKNVQLGRLREAVGLNQEGVAFNFNMLVGQPCVVAIKHNPDKNDSNIVYANVSKVASAS